MNKFIKIFFSILLISIVLNCQPQKATPQEAQQTQEFLQSQNFRFLATRAYPMNNNMVNRIMGNNAPNLTNLSYGYTMSVTPNTISADLPYFGQAYAANMDRDKAGIKFTSKDFKINKQQNGKKITLNIQFNDVPSISNIYLEVYPSGKSFLSVNANDRQPISYDGYLEKNPESQQKN